MLFLLVLIAIFVTVNLSLKLNRHFSISSLPALNSPTPISTASPENEIVDNQVELIFAGDVMLDRNIRQKAQQNGYNFLIGSNLKAVLVDADHAVVNLEGPITSNQSVSVGSAVGSTRNYIFTFPPETPEFLLDQNMTIVNVGNNHILNFGIEGLGETYALLDKAEINYFGNTGPSQPPDSSTFILSRGDRSIGFVNYNQFISGGEEQAFADINKIKPLVDYIVLYAHWGNEYQQENEVLITLAHKFVDAGVDLLIGSHPHIVTGHEIYNDKHIYYSLGNFIFDQYFDTEVRRGLVVKASINLETGATEITEYPVSINPNGQTELD